MLSLLVDLPNDNWSNSPDFKNGPLLRAGVIISYGLILGILYKDKDFITNLYSNNPGEVRRVKFKFYLYYLIQLLFVIYAYSHETMDPAIEFRYPKPEQYLEQEYRMCIFFKGIKKTSF